jgi:ATP-dependent Lhr-like helicase
MIDSTPGAFPGSFHPLVSSWFAARYGDPTPVQAAAWPVIASGAHMLASAPTGSGKTLTAFLGALSRFATGEYPPEGLSVLYISPLKALNEDVRLNLVAPSHELSTWFSSRGETFPKIRIASRSGDTPQSERRSMLSKPPAILCTTPESLAIMLSSRSGLGLLSTVRLLILDEVHAVLGTKRGSTLACSAGRLALLAGEFQRVALSATVRPFEEAARFVGGARLTRSPDGTASYEPRPVCVVAPPADKRYELSVAWPAAPIGIRPPTAGPDDREADEPAGRYDAVVGDLAERIAHERSTIVFADSRRRTERLAAMLNERSGEGTAWAHHGSLSKDVRKAVETRLKEGRLRCVVATGTLELGIDVGAVDLVAMAGAPSRADQLLQRAGRAGHGVGLSSRAVVYPFHGLDLLAAAAAVGAALERDIDPVRPPRCPLDVLAQTLLSMALFEERRLDDLYDDVRSFRPFEGLPRRSFDAVVGMLSGRFAGSRLKELAGRVYLDAERGTIRAKEGAAMLLYSSGGSIPDRGYYAMRMADGGARIGELDEEFVFERRVGNSFSFGSQAWRIVSIGDEAVTVAPLDRDADFMPFWKADKAPRGASVSRRMLSACAEYESFPEGFAAGLRAGLGFSGDAADALSAFLASQARAQGGAPLPSETVVPVELFADPGRKAGSTTLVIHTLRGAAVNEPLGIALAAAVGGRLGLVVDRLSDDDAVSLALPLADSIETEAAVRAAFAEFADPARLAALIRDGLPETAVFGASFRENAGRALLLPRSGFGKRTPLWVTRLRAKRLYERTIQYEDFPVVEETWKSVLEGRFDLGALEDLCRGIVDGTTRLAFFRSRAPSPFARQSGWAETNRYLYEGDGMPGAGGRAAGASASPSDAAIEDALRAMADHDGAARPRVRPALAAEYGRKLRRELPGWAPESADALADWVDERVALPLDEWEALLEACPGELAAAARLAVASPGTADGLLGRLVAGRVPGASTNAVLRRERLAGADTAMPPEDRARLAAEWLKSTGPTPLSVIRALFGLVPTGGESPSALLEATGSVIAGDLGFMGGPDGVAGACDRDVLESLLRQSRKAARLAVHALPASSLPAFIAGMQGVRDRLGSTDPVGSADGIAATRRALSPLSGYPAPAALWETEILPARVGAYRPEYLDALLASGEFLWFGAGKETVAFVTADDFEAFSPEVESLLVGTGEPPMDAWAIKDRMGLSIAELEERIWGDIWSGAISSTDFTAVRQAAAAGFRRVSVSGDDAAKATGRPAAGRRGRIPLALSRRWKTGAPVAGSWFSLALEDAGRDEADRLELAVAAVRAIARRYGLVCKATIDRELPAITWSYLSRAVRKLELAGELSWGKFFEGVDGPQFMSAEGLRAFRAGGFDDRLWSVNACDPASPAGLAIDGLPAGIPSRLPVNRLSMRAGMPICASRRSWRDLEIHAPPEDPAVGPALAFLVEARRRAVAPERRVAIASINGDSAAASPYADMLLGMGFDADRGTLTLW